MIVLVGFMGAGKSTVGPLLAAGLGLPFADLDQVIERQQGRPVRDIFAAGGEAAFRAVEHEALASFLAGPDAVLALGGGAVEHPASQRLLRPVSAVLPVVYLEVGYDEALRRVGGDSGRPMLASPDLAGIYRRRLAGYEAVATLTVATGGRPARAVCDEVMAGLTRLERAGYSH
ncbi:MAG TPA: shikimate kinase [Streptosporangiaceae bacterium]